MNLDSIYLMVNNVSFDDLLPQTLIVAAEDIVKYSNEGYPVMMTANEVAENYGIDPGNVYYTKSISLPAIYFNKESFAVLSLFPLTMPDGHSMAGQIREAIAEQEQRAACGDYFSALQCLSETAMAMEYLDKLVESGRPISDLYKLFIAFYTHNDYGAGNLSVDAMTKIMAAKTTEQRSQTAKRLERLPDVVRVYRGGNTESAPAEAAYAWSLDVNVANFFAARRGNGPGYIAEGEVRKEDILELYNERNEREVIVMPGKAHIRKTLELEGLDYLEEALPKVTPMYREFREALDEVEFRRESDIHGKAHEARVMLLSLLIADKLGLPTSDKEVLATAAIYHDSRRTNDGEDTEHGLFGRRYYERGVSDADPLVSFLCEYHCKPDTEGYAEIKRNPRLEESSRHAKLLYDIFKDADALDRVRFEIRNLDLKKLRLPESKTMTLAARLILSGLKV